MKFNILFASLLLISAWITFTNARIDPNNPPTARTGAPGETTCQQSTCHGGGSFTGTVSISGVPDTITANTTYTLTITNASNAVRAGFEMTCWDGANAMCGTFTAPNGSGVSIGSGPAGKKYPRQSSPKTLSNGSASWTFTWKSPATASGNKATFYFVSLCANGNGEETLDNVLQSNKTVFFKTTSPVADVLDAQSFKLYPTVVDHGVMMLEWNLPAQGKLQIFDLQGKLVFQQVVTGNAELNLAALNKGVYTVQISAGDKAATRKIVVE